MKKQRLKLKHRGTPKKKSGGLYFLDQFDNEFVGSGCALLDRVLGGGYALRRVVNIVGDKSVGKTLLALEACINFHKQHPKGRIRYREPEAALGKGYAKEMGLPMNRIEWDDEDNELDSVEDFAEDLQEFVEELEDNQPGLYILDSLDALDSEEEKKSGFRKGSYGGAKPKLMSKMFRQLVRKIKHKRVLLIVISQTRDNIGAMFGEKHTRTGGRALDFYASQILWLANLGKINRVINRVTRTIGNRVKAHCKKNKVGIAHRECEMEIRYGYGIDDVASNLRWLATIGKAGLVKPGLGSDPGKITNFLSQLEDSSDIEHARIRQRLNEIVPEAWKEVEEAFLPTRRKYK